MIFKVHVLQQVDSCTMAVFFYLKLFFFLALSHGFFFLWLQRFMIDKLTLRCSFKRTLRDKSSLRLELEHLGVPLQQSLDRDGQIINTRHSWESIPSSFSGMAFKIFDLRHTKFDDFYIVIKCSPAKLMYGQNIYGSSDLVECAFFMINFLHKNYPLLEKYLDFESWILEDIDITYFSRADSNTEAMQFINALSNVSHGQTKSRTGYNGTAYFGQKNSKLKKIKVYAKHPETLEILKKNPAIEAVIDESLLEFAVGMVRWEVTLYRRYLERKGLSCKLSDLIENNSLSKENLITFWTGATKGLFKSLEGKEMKIANDNEVKELLRAKFSKVGKTGKVSYVAADSAFMTYQFLKMNGWLGVKSSFSNDKFYRHIRMLTEAGLSRAYLQNLNGIDKSNVIPFIRFIGVDFGAQLPQGITETETGGLVGVPTIEKRAVRYG